MKKLLTVLLIAAVLVTSGNAAPVIVPTSVRDLPSDAFSPTGSITILGSSTVVDGSALNLFGGRGGTEGDDALFSNAPVGTTYFVDWQTSAPVRLSSYRVVLSDDAPTNNRAISQVRLFFSSDPAFTNPTLLSSATISSPYNAAYGSPVIEVRDYFTPVTARYFRLEFVNASVLGPRIIEVDGNSRQTQATTDGVFLSRGGVLSKIAAAGETVAGVGTLSRDFDGPAFNNNSTVAFAARGILGGGSVTGAVFIKKLNEPLTALVKTGDPAPVPGGGVFASTVGIPFDDLALNSNDDLAFIAIYTQDGGATFKMGIFLKPDGQPIVPIVLNGDALPGTGGTFCGTTFGNDPLAPPIPDNGSIDGPWMNDSQVVAFKADAICGASQNFGESAFVKRPGMPIEQAVLIGEPAPGVSGGFIESVEVGRPGLNNLNVFAFHSSVNTASTTEAAEVIYTRTLGVSPLLPPLLQVKTGDPAPRTSGTFRSLSAPAINQTGLLLFWADITGDPTITQGIFYSIGGITQAIALEGDTMPGTNGKKFCSSIEEGSLSNDGRFVFFNESFLNETVCPPFGLFATSPLGAAGAEPNGTITPTIMPIALEGDPAPGTNGGVFGYACIYRTCSEGLTVFDEPSINTSGDVVFIAGVILPPQPQLRNISTRGVVMDGDNVLIGGFMLRGVDPKTVLIRGIGPSLAINAVPLAGRMSNPKLSLMRGSTQIDQNNDWRSDNEAGIAATGLPPSNDAEAAILRTLPPGDYTAILSGEDNIAGIGLVEIYDVDFSTLSALANVSTRGLVQTQDNVLIGGFIVQPAAQTPPTNQALITTSTVKVIARAIGPSMAMPGVLADPTIDLVDVNGMIIRSNDDWTTSPQQSEIAASGLAPPNTKESAVIENLGPGAYTAIVRGSGQTSGIALVEVYELDPPGFFSRVQ